MEFDGITLEFEDGDSKDLSIDAAILLRDTLNEIFPLEFLKPAPQRHETMFYEVSPGKFVARES